MFKLFSKLFDISNDIRELKNKRASRIICSIVSIILIVAIYFVTNSMISSFNNSNFIVTILWLLLELILIVTNIKFLIYEIAIFIISIKTISNKEYIGNGITGIALFAVYLISIILFVVFIIN